HEFVRGSHRNYGVLNDKVYYTDEEVNNAYPAGGPHRVVSEVKAGTVIIEDTRGLHRARMPDAGQRDLGYAVFVPFLPGREQSYYRVPRAACAEFNEMQQAFIPEVCLT
ncbi:MAG: phytanoyl-CoA dioxygenase, partial [Betaproteobacteria bacterium]|nr:phytanoyl-CoA dioxygenase [Betaproteobacteria bacterium]